MTTNITIKRVEGKSGGYWLATGLEDIGWSPDNGRTWFDSSSREWSDASAILFRLAYKKLIDSEAGGEVEEEPETFTGDAREWGPGVYATEDLQLFVCVDHLRKVAGFLLGGVVFAQHWYSCRPYTRLSTNPADFPKILAEHGEGE